MQDKNWVLLLCLHIFISSFLLSNILFLIPCLPFIFWSSFYFSIYLFCIFLVWLNFDPSFTFYLQVNVNFCSMNLTSTHLKTWMIGTSPSFFLALMEFEGWLFNYLNNLMGLNCIGKGMWKGKKDKGNWCHLQSNLRLVKVLHPHFHLSHLSNDPSHHGHIHPLWDSLGPKMMEFVEFSIKLLSKIKGESSLSEVSNLFFLWMQKMRRWVLCTWFLIWMGSLLGTSISKFIISYLHCLTWLEVLPYY